MEKIIVILDSPSGCDERTLELAALISPTATTREQENVDETKEQTIAIITYINPTTREVLDTITGRRTLYRYDVAWSGSE